MAKKKRKASPAAAAGKRAKKTMEVDLRWLEDKPETASPEATTETRRRSTIDVDPAWLEEPPTVELAMPKRVVRPPTLPPPDASIAETRIHPKMPPLPREDPSSERPPPLPRRSSKRPPR